MISVSRLIFLNLKKHRTNNIIITTQRRRKVSCFLRNIITMSAAIDQNLGFVQPRLVTKKVLAKAQSEGEGAVVRRSIGR